MSTKKSARKTPIRKPAARKAPAKKPAAASVKKAVSKAGTNVTKTVAPPPKKTTSPQPKKTMEPKPIRTNPAKKDVGIFGVIQKNIQEGISVLTETILPTPKRTPRRR